MPSNSASISQSPNPGSLRPMMSSNMFRPVTSPYKVQFLTYHQALTRPASRKTGSPTLTNRVKSRRRQATTVNTKPASSHSSNPLSLVKAAQPNTRPSRTITDHEIRPVQTLANSTRATLESRMTSMSLLTSALVKRNPGVKALTAMAPRARVVLPGKSSRLRA